MPDLRLIASTLSCLLVFSCSSSQRERPRAADGMPPSAEASAPRNLLLRKDSKDDLVFPPPLKNQRRARPALHIAPPELETKVEPFGVSEPSSRSFSVSDQELNFTFNRDVQGARTGAVAGTALSLKPSIAGVATWRDARTLEFKAAQAFDPSIRYEVSLSKLVSTEGESMETPWQGSFTASGPRLAGKELGYLPTSGDARVVGISVADEQLVSRQPKWLVLYDQPLSLELARRRIELRRGQELIPLRVTQAATGNYNGYGVPRPQLFSVQAVKRLSPGDELEVTVMDEAPGNDRLGLTARLRVAPPFEHQRVSCGYSSSACEQSASSLLLDHGQLTIAFNNPLGHDSRELRGLIQVAPRPANLSIYSYNYYASAELSVRGDFRPGTTYRVAVPRLRDRFGGQLKAPLSFSVRRRPLPASLSMAEGALWLDAKQVQSFEFTSRNVERAQLWLWQVPLDDQTEYSKALNGDLSDRPPFVVLPIDVRPSLDQFVTTSVDLSRVLREASAFLVQLRHDVAAFDAKPPNYPVHSAANSAPSVVLSHGATHGLNVHVHTTGGKSLVFVSDHTNGNVVPNAQVRLGPAATYTPTNSNGVAILDSAQHDGQALLEVRSKQRRLLLPLRQEGTRSNVLFPELGGVTNDDNQRVVWQTDRGVYRPGETLHTKVNLFERSPAGLRPLSNQQFEWSITGADGQELKRAKIMSNALGSISFDYRLPKRLRLGNASIALERDRRILDRHAVRVAAFEAPKFVLDIDAPPSLAAPLATLGFHARYLFGAPLAALPLEWSLAASRAPVPSGSHTRAGLSFEATEGALDDEPAIDWSTTGRGTLDASGKLSVSTHMPLSHANAPVKLRVQAEVRDESYETAAAERSLLFHPAKRYAGLALDKQWVGSGDTLLVRLGVSDRSGQAVGGVTVEARLHRVVYHAVQEKTPSGALRRHYKREQKLVARCSVVSAQAPESCSLKPKQGGRHVISAWVDGRPGGTQSLWVSGASTNPQTDSSPKARVSLVADKTSYQPGETARLLFENPLAHATALVTLEGHDLYAHRAFAVRQGVHTVDLPLATEHAPFVHATVSLIPRPDSGTRRAPIFGAVRLPVAVSDAQLSVELKSDRSVYKPKQRARIDIAVRHQGKGVADAEVLLFVVDEGVLRLTSFQPQNPLTELWQGSPLDFSFNDTRWDLARWHAQSHVAGDGGDEADLSALLTRRKFVHTALWEPHLKLAADGRGSVDFELPDNLTQFRMLAVAIDAKGRSGLRQGSFEVTKKVLLSPAMPRFAKVGDNFEAAALLHNTSGQAFDGTLSIGGKQLKARIPAQARVRIGTNLRFDSPGEKSLTFVLKDNAGHDVDRVEHPFNVTPPGVSQKPRLTGTFKNSQRIHLKLPEATAEEEHVRLVVGENLQPELGAQLEFLLGYPHGCVEQTTSSTLPLVAARKVLPLLGLREKSESFYDTRIRHGLNRLNSMRTRSGGLAYWPGGHEPNVFGTAYAMRAVLGSEQLGIKAPEGLREGMLNYLSRALFGARIVPEVRTAIALSLAESRQLKATDADALFDLKQDVGVFGKANLALALNTLPHQSKRVQQLLDAIEAQLHAGGELAPANREDLHSFSSDTRALAQASLALARLRPQSEELAPSVQQLFSLDEGYTTQATAYRLLALSEHVLQASRHPTFPAVTLDNVELKATRTLKGGAQEYLIPLAALKGKQRRLDLKNNGQRQVAFSLSAAYSVSQPDQQAAVMFAATSDENGPDLYRLFTTPEGDPLNLREIKAGDLVRVALLAERPAEQAGVALDYLAISDALPAGFEPVDTALDTVRAGPAVDPRHPWYAQLNSSPRADHTELGDDEVRIYFDHPRQSRVATSYLVRATNPGRFQLSPARAELMYEAHSTSYTESDTVVVR